jgi:hypothetical protein
LIKWTENFLSCEKPQFHLKLKLNSKHSQGDIKVKLDKPINDKKIILTNNKGADVDYIKTR